MGIDESAKIFTCFTKNSMHTCDYKQEISVDIYHKKELEILKWLHLFSKRRKMEEKGRQLLFFVKRLLALLNSVM